MIGHPKGSYQDVIKAFTKIRKYDFNGLSLISSPNV